MGFVLRHDFFLHAKAIGKSSPGGKKTPGRGQTICGPGIHSTWLVAVVTKADDAAAVALGGAASGSGRKVQSRPALFRKSLARFAAGFGFPIELLRNRRRPASVAERKNLDVEVPALIPDGESIADPHFAGRAGRLMIGYDPAQLTRFRGERARLEEARGPKPFVETNAVHGVSAGKSPILSVGEYSAKALARVPLPCKSSAQNFCTGVSLPITTTSCGRKLENTQVVRFLL